MMPAIMPYKGLMPYSEEDARFFFGREPQQEIITANLMASRLTLLYGASGVGKSSVLRAGVSNHLRQLTQQNLLERQSAEFVGVVFSSWRDDPLAALSARVEEAVKHAFKGQGFDLAPQSRSLAQTLDAWTDRIGGDLLIILDQFEEYFLYHSKEDGDGTFAVEFPRALNRADLRVSFLISIREDAVAKLDRFKGRIPNLFDNYLRIEHLDREAASDAITKPIKQYNTLYGNGERISIEPELVDAILDQVKTGSVFIGEAGCGMIGGKKAEKRIETPFLQLVMERLWNEEVQAGSLALRLETLDRLGGAERIVKTHLDGAMSKLQAHEQNVASRIFHFLVTPSGTKIAHSTPDLADYSELSESQLTPVLENLAGDVRILRAVTPPGQSTASRYEIFHDVLSAPILDWRSRYVKDHERAEAERRAATDAAEQEKEANRQKDLVQARALAVEQQKRADENHRANRRLMWGTLALAMMFIVAVGAAVVATNEQAKAEGSRRKTEEAQAELNDISEKRAIEAEAAATHARADEQAAKTLQAEADGLRKDAQENATLALARAVEAETATRLKDAALNIERLKGAALVHAQNNELPRALATYEELITLYSQSHNRSGVAATYNSIAVAYQRFRRYDEAHKFCEKALSIQKEISDFAGEAKTLVTIGSIFNAEGKRSQALGSYRQALLRFQKAEDREEQAKTLATIASTHNIMGNRKDAREYYVQALKLREELQDPYGRATTLTNIAAIDRARGESKLAIDSYEKAIELFQKLEDRREEASILVSVASIYSSTGERNTAIKKAERALTIRKDLREPRGEADVLNLLGQIHLSMGEKDRAIERYNELLRIWQRLPDRYQEANTYSAIAQAYDYKSDKRADKEKAIENFTTAGHLFRAVGDRYRETEMLRNVSRIYESMGEKDKALEFSQRTQLSAKIETGRERASAGDINGAIKLFREAQAIDPKAIADPEAEARRIAADNKMRLGGQLARQGKIKESISAYVEAQSINPALRVDGNYLNTLCWYGALSGSASEVMHSCEQAVRAYPDNWFYRDSRGVARAITGNIRGAIEDFEFYVKHAGHQDNGQRAYWINELRAGRNPFSPETLRRLAQQ